MAIHIHIHKKVADRKKAKDADGFPIKAAVAQVETEIRNAESRLSSNRGKPSGKLYAEAIEAFKRAASAAKAGKEDEFNRLLQEGRSSMMKGYKKMLGRDTSAQEVVRLKSKLKEVESRMEGKVPTEALVNERAAIIRALKKINDAAIKYKEYRDFPVTVKYKGEIYVRTAKQGTNFKTGMKAQEYAYEDGNYDKRLWVLADGTIQPD